MINLVPEELKKEEPKPKAEAKEFEMIKPEALAKEERPPVKAQPTKPLVNPWIESGLNLDQELKPAGKRGETEAVGPLLKDTFKTEQAPAKIISTRGISFKETSVGKFLFKAIEKIYPWLVELIKGTKTGEVKPKKQRGLKPAEAPLATGLSGLEITLMPKEAPITRRMINERLLILLAFIAFLFLVIFIGWSWVNWRSKMAKIKTSQIKTEIVAIESKISGYQDMLQQIRSLDKKSSRAIDLLNNHIYWTRFFKLLETYTIPDVYFTKFSAQVDTKITLPTIGRNLIAAAKQLAAFSSATDFIKEVTITDLNAGTKGVTFNTNLSLTSSVLKK